MPEETVTQADTTVPEPRTGLDVKTWLLAASRELPYFSRAIAAITPVLKPGFMTLAVDDRWRMYWSPEGLDALLATGSAPVSLIQHELEHLLRQHGARRGARQHKAWNACCDAEINDDIPHLHGCIFPSTLGGQDHDTAEVYYDTLEKEAQDEGKGKCCGGGSGVDGEQKDYEAGDEVVGVKDGEVPQILDQVAADIKAAAARGTVPGGALVWADARLKKQAIDWRRLLAAQVRQAKAAVAGYWTQTYTKANRHQGRDRIIHPGYSQPVSNVDVIVDTSGSMGGFGDIVAGVADSLRQTAGPDRNVRLIACDAAVHGTKTLKSWADVKALKGGGGTDLTVAFDVVTAPIVVVITDGDTPWPAEAPSGTRVIAVLTRGAPSVPAWVVPVRVPG